jgi:hypothetical protein
MVKPATNNNNSNRNASVVTFKQQGKQVYANALLNTKGLTEPCTNRVTAGPSPNTSYSGATYIDQRVGANATTCVEKAEILASDKCLELEQ